MQPTTSGALPLAERVRVALESRDVAAFGALMADDARWGDDDAPNRCRSRADVTETLARGLAAGGDAEILELVTGTDGILCALRVRWPGQPVEGILYHVYLVSAGRIVEIRRFDDRASALEAAGAAGAAI